MTVQITVRLPEELVAFVDAQVMGGQGDSRASVVSEALQRLERHRVAAAETAEIAARRGDLYGDTGALVDSIDHSLIDYDQ